MKARARDRTDLGHARWGGEHRECSLGDRNITAIQREFNHAYHDRGEQFRFATDAQLGQLGCKLFVVAERCCQRNGNRRRQFASQASRQLDSFGDSAAAQRQLDADRVNLRMAGADRR